MTIDASHTVLSLVAVQCLVIVDNIHHDSHRWRCDGLINRYGPRLSLITSGGTMTLLDYMNELLLEFTSSTIAKLKKAAAGEITTKTQAIWTIPVRHGPRMRIRRRTCTSLPLSSVLCQYSGSPYYHS